MTYDKALPINLYRAENVREIDRLAIEEHGIDGFELMQKAARFTFHLLNKLWPETKSLLVICGAGNNAGDGYIVAGLAKKHGIKVEVYYLYEPSKLTGDAHLAYDFCTQQGVNCQTYTPEIDLKSTDLIVDAILGTGVNKAVTGAFESAIRDCNESKRPILAVDIPSGLSADTGQPFGIAINASATATFIGLKIGQFTGRGRAYCGQLYFDQLDVPNKIIDGVAADANRLDITTLLSALPPRQADAHKGNFGHVLLIGGDHGFGGAITMAAKACARMGAGLVSVATHAEHCSVVLSHCPEVMVKAVHSSGDLKPLLKQASVVVIGPGLGQSAWSQHMLFTALQQSKTCILDADALNLICQHPEWLPTPRENLIFTPHPGEAARMLGCATDEIQSDRIQAINQLCDKYGGTFVLKGSGTLVKQSDQFTKLCSYGNPGMATGGMGDVLSGMIAGLVAQKLNCFFAVSLGVALHAKAADLVANKSGERGMLATDLIPVSRQLLNGIVSAD